MKLLNARVIGFQSFEDSGNITFLDGINLFVGQNNSGKSAFLRALQPSLADDRHRCKEKWQDFLLPLPRVRLKLQYSGEELKEALLQRGVNEVYIPIPDGQSCQAHVTEILSTQYITTEVTSEPNRDFSADYPSHGLFTPNDQSKYFAISRASGGNLNFAPSYGMNDTVPSVLNEIWSRKMFYFSAERMNVGTSSAEPAQRLADNARNLPSVLLTLNGDRGTLFQRLVGHAREVFSTIGNLSIRPVGGGAVEIRVWPTESMEHVELSFPLLNSGTGISQVLSILTAVMTVENAVIMIDEINSFLHPAAVKSLIRILKTQYSSHQYIISTHAPEVISFSDPKTINLVSRVNYNSKVKQLEVEQVESLKEIADNLGVSMTDVFAADNIIWVEGPTEELCFPYLFESLCGKALPRGTIFTSVVATGDFISKRRDKELIYQIYEKLSGAASPLVRNVTFSFDSEDLSASDKEDMIRMSRGRLHLLPRRHLECYVLNPEALARFLNQKCGEEVTDGTRVASMLQSLSENERFIVPEFDGDLENSSWLSRVDAANLIATACTTLSDHRVNFRKKGDTLELLKFVAEIAPHQILELRKYVESLVGSTAGG
ncbi:Predicted ATPase [Sphingomonas sp. NFR04]|uniref:ATP-dependent nuclease n=1 Tax=Sphingomonas sp. NFR04 TaxID=1566283 RepID=UPI0008ED447E|nr:AAA family ATPase [Sphingomonas sp. NFR04]SFJ57241.1 Predicted ATPase [Sphingomonas sp. NFR04]